MGRRHFLARLALGRSAFQAVEDAGPADVVMGSGDDEQTQRQVYDTRGRPFSARTDLRKAEMRRAQNTILSLVGVVEEHRQQVARDELNDLETWVASRRRTDMMRDEDQKGEDVDDALTALQHMLHWLPCMVIARYQSGLYDARTPLLLQMNQTIAHNHGPGWQGVISALLPGAVAQFIHTLSGVVLTNLVEVVIDLLQKSVITKSALGRKHTNRLYAGLDLLWSAALLAIDAALLPLEFYAITQMLGIRPAFPLLPPWQLLVPWGATSAHKSIWDTTISTPVLCHFCSPAALLLALRLVYEESDPSAGVPICNTFTRFRFSTENPQDRREGNEVASKRRHPDRPSPRFVEDPLGWTLYRMWVIRCRVMNACGWDAATSDPMTLANPTVLPVQQYRPTSLARLPIKRLATSIDIMLQTILVLPLHSLAYRSVVTAYLGARSLSTISVLPRGMTNVSLGIGSGPLSIAIRQLGSYEALANLGSYVSKIGLGLAAHSLVDVSVVAIAYYTAQRYG